MAKTKTPFLSLGARGSIGNVITAQKRDGATLLRKKPTPGYRFTLPQAYQRWLYQDYAYLWTKQTATTKRQYASDGVRFHLTGFQYWMKVMLNTLPDIVAWYKLDEKTGAIAYDAGALGHHATILGASPSGGIIDQARLFDGLNDRIVTPFNTYDYGITHQGTLLAFVRPTIAQASSFFQDYHFVGAKGITFRMNANRTLQYYSFPAIAGWNVTSVKKIPLNSWSLVAALHDGTTASIYVADELYAQTPQLGDIQESTSPLYVVGNATLGSSVLAGILDNTIIFNRPLDTTELLRWSRRRYPI